LNSIFYWQLLPWKKINTRILLIQQKIFNAAKEYNCSRLHRIQNYLLNSDELKLIAINKVINSLSEYSQFYNNRDYYFNDQEKLSIFTAIFTNIKNQYNKPCKTSLIIEKVREYMIYLCIEMEWKAKYDNLNHSLIIKKSNIQIKNYNVVYSETELNALNVRNKLQSLPYINIFIKYWLENLSYTYCKYLSPLLLLLNKISLIGLEWNNIKFRKLYFSNKINNIHFISNSKKNILLEDQLNEQFFFLYSIYCKNINKILINIYSNKKIIKEIYTIIRKIIYSKDSLERNRLKNHININIIIEILSFELQKYYLNNLFIINELLIKKSFHLLNQIFSKLISINKILYFYKINSIIVMLYKLLYNKKTSYFLYFYLVKINR